MKISLSRLTGFVALLIFTVCFEAKSQGIVVKTSKGFMRGTIEDQSMVFKGVPYAQPPVGALRFKPPVPVLAWADTLSCEKFGSMASQYGGTQQPLKGNENCLSLNIYAPAVKAKAGLPVLVWVHGGSMTAGAGMGQNGHAFSDKDSIVTVTINYRLGVFGFMYLGDLGAGYKQSGNNGLLDLIIALKWIRENISAFGGDPSKVTVIGESAGAKLTSCLLTAPEAKSYFSQLILESGAVQCIRDTNTAKSIRQRILNELNVKNAAEVLDMPAEKLIAAQGRVCRGAIGTNFFGPVADGVTITGDPYVTTGKNKNSDVRFLIGTNKLESRLFMGLDKRLLNPDTASLSDWFGDNYHYVLSAYKKAAKTDPDSAAIKILTQYMYQMHSYRLANNLAQAGDKVWMYRFDYSKDGTGATHAEELPYVWFLPRLQHFNDTEVVLGNQIHQAWVNFIKGWAPGNVGTQSWPLYNRGSKPVMVFDKTPGEVNLKTVYNDPVYPSAGFVLK